MHTKYISWMSSKNVSLRIVYEVRLMNVLCIEGRVSIQAKLLMSGQQPTTQAFRTTYLLVCVNQN